LFADRSTLHAPALHSRIACAMRRARCARIASISGAASVEMRRRCRANTRYPISNAGRSGAQPVGRMTQPRPTAAYARRSTSTPLSIEPSGRMPWISASTASKVNPKRAASKPGCEMSSNNNRPSRQRARR